MNRNILALDIGEKRIGIAIGNRELAIAMPRCVLHRKNRDADLAALMNIAREEQAAGWIVGLPRQADDSLGESARKVLGFARRLQQFSKMPLCFVDEWETTVQAQDILLSADMSRQRRRQVVDKLAASLILERFFKYGALDMSKVLGNEDV